MANDALQKVASDGRSAAAALRWLAGGRARPSMRHGTDDAGRYVQTQRGERAARHRNARGVEAWLQRHADYIQRERNVGSNGGVEAVSILVGERQRGASYLIEAKTVNDGAARVRIKRIVKAHDRALFVPVKADGPTRAGTRVFARTVLKAAMSRP